ncbi:MAG: uncharacterized protein JWM10_2001 [Myxococcaceae bacterium]|nr:uncharacterized protein [Myxococcaceae bacterium]
MKLHGGFRAVGVLGLAACSPAEAPVFTTRSDAAVIGQSDVVVRDAIPIPDRGTQVIEPDASCMTTTADARRLPVNLLIVLDRSGSMSDNGKWVAAQSGLRTLLGRLDGGIRVGLTMFPAPAGAGSADRATTYASPLVPIAPLSANRARLISTLDDASPGGNTPMNCATEGSRSYYDAFTMDGSRNVILITDGQPTSECTTAPVCNNPFDPNFFNCVLSQAGVASTEVRVSVARGARGTPPIRYFIAGTPDATDAFLSDLAFTGNTPRTPDCQRTTSCHYRLSTGSFEADLTHALDEIRGRAVSCEFEVDADPTRVDTTRVNVNVTSGAGGAQVIPRDVDHNNGWDYSPGMRSVVLHGPACDRVLSDDGASVRIVFGCPTLTPG